MTIGKTRNRLKYTKESKNRVVIITRGTLGMTGVRRNGESFVTLMEMSAENDNRRQI
jgi:hypothetical protein